MNTIPNDHKNDLAEHNPFHRWHAKLKISYVFFIYQKNHHHRLNLVKMSYTGIRRKPKEKLAP